MKNRLSDLNDHLFMQLERLANEDLTAEQIESEVKRADAIVSVADKIVENAGLTLRAVELVAKHGDRFQKQLPMIATPTIEGK
jgi:ribosomal protein L17